MREDIGRFNRAPDRAGIHMSHRTIRQGCSQCFGLLAAFWSKCVWKIPVRKHPQHVRFTFTVTHEIKLHGKSSLSTRPNIAKTRNSYHGKDYQPKSDNRL